MILIISHLLIQHKTLIIRKFTQMNQMIMLNLRRLTNKKRSKTFLLYLFNDYSFNEFAIYKYLNLLQIEIKV